MNQTIDLNQREQLRVILNSFSISMLENMPEEHIHHLCTPDFDHYIDRINKVFNPVDILTSEKLIQIPAGTIFSEGTIPNSPEGVYMTDSRYGELLYWVAKKGFGWSDWAIYVHWAESGRYFVITNGEKVSSIENIKKLVPCTDEVLKLYRR